jgi:hypothetical protein
MAVLEVLVAEELGNRDHGPRYAQAHQASVGCAWTRHTGTLRGITREVKNSGGLGGEKDHYESHQPCPPLMALAPKWPQSYCIH